MRSAREVARFRSEAQFFRCFFCLRVMRCCDVAHDDDVTAMLVFRAAATVVRLRRSALQLFTRAYTL